MGYIAEAYITQDENIFGVQELFWKLGGRGRLSNDRTLLVIDGSKVSALKGNAIFDFSNYINCNSYTPNGTEEEAVKLFLELAQMRDDVNEGQWYYWLDEGEGDRLRKRDDNENWSWWRFEVRRATPTEVAEAFRDGRIEL